MKTTEAELRELDAWICENIFGHKVNWEAGRRKHGPGWLWYDDGPPRQCEQVLHYTTDPAAAMQVLERCNQHINKRKYREVIGISTLCGEPLIRYDPDQIIVHAETLPLAICKFARALFAEGKE